jgi:ATP-binding cassette subfamily B protein
MNMLKTVIYKNGYLIISYILLGIFLQFLGNLNTVFFQNVIDNYTDGTLRSTDIFIYGAVLTVLCVLYWFEEYPSNKLQNGIHLG